MRYFDGEDQEGSLVPARVEGGHGRMPRGRPSNKFLWTARAKMRRGIFGLRIASLDADIVKPLNEHFARQQRRGLEELSFLTAFASASRPR